MVAKKSIINAHSQLLPNEFKQVCYTTKYDLAWKRKLVGRWKYRILLFILCMEFLSLSLALSTSVPYWIIFNDDDDDDDFSTSTSHIPVSRYFSHFVRMICELHSRNWVTVANNPVITCPNKFARCQYSCSFRCEFLAYVRRHTVLPFLLLSPVYCSKWIAFWSKRQDKVLHMLSTNKLYTLRILFAQAKAKDEDKFSFSIVTLC